MTFSRRDMLVATGLSAGAVLFAGPLYATASDNMDGIVSPNMPPPSWRTIDDLNIRYVDSGPQAGPDILLLSPWPESIYGFAEIWKPLTAHGRVVALDMPGIGRSQGRADLMAAQPMGHFLQKAVTAFGLKAPHVIGPDIGTHAALFAASDFPGIFSSAIIGSATLDQTRIGSGLKMVVDSTPEQFAAIKGADVVAGVAGTLKNYKLPPAILADYQASYAGPRFAPSAMFLRGFPETLPELRRRLPSLDLPCLVIGGTNDPFVLSGNAELFKKLLPHSRLEMVDAGHSVWEEQAATYARLSNQWIAGGYKAV